MKNEEAKSIIKTFDRYILRVASRHNQPEFQSDLIQIGRMAALDAASKFDSTKGSLTAFTTTYIKYEMMKFLTNNARTIRIPANQQSEVHIPTISISTPIGEEGSTIEDFIPASDTYIPPTQNEALKTALMTLSEKERLVLELHLDLNDESEPMTLKAIGDMMGVSRERARQIYQKAITKMQIEMGAKVKSNKLTHSTSWYERNKTKK